MSLDAQTKAVLKQVITQLRASEDVVAQLDTPVYEDSDAVSFGTGSDVTMTFNGTKFIIDCAADDTVMDIGDGTTSFDINIFGAAATDTIAFDASANTLKLNGVDLSLLDNDILGFGDADDITFTYNATDLIVAGTGVIDSSVAVEAPLTVAATGSGTLAAADLNKVHTTRGATGAVTYTLPAASGNSGNWVEFYNVADQDMTVAGQDEELVVLNDLTADSISFSTASEKIGGGFRAVCDGTSWIVVPLATETQTVTIASA